MSTHKDSLRKKLVSKQQNIKYESSEDEGAAEYYAELQSIIKVIDSGASDDDIKKACEWVGESYE